MSTDAAHRAEVSPRQLWFGFLAPAVAWTAAGCLDVVVAWRACTHQEDFGIPPAHPYARILVGLLGLALLVICVGAGILSYRNWKRLTAAQTFLDAQAVERREFLAVLGVLITVTLGMGILWLALPPIFLDLCWRAR